MRSALRKLLAGNNMGGSTAAPAANPAVIENQSIVIGSDTLAGAGGVRPVFTGGTPSLWAISGGQSANYAIHSTNGNITPSGNGSAVNGDTFTVTVDGLDTATITIVAAANEFSVRDMTEAKAALQSFAGGGGKTVRFRAGDYGQDGDLTRNRAFTSRTVITVDAGATATFTQIDVENTDYLTLDGLTFYRDTAGEMCLLRAGAIDPIVQNCTFSGPTISPTGDYSASSPTNISAIAWDGTTPPTNASILNNTVHDVVTAFAPNSTGVLRIEGNLVYNFYGDCFSLDYYAGRTATYVKDNILIGMISNPNDYNNPHPDFMHFRSNSHTLVADWASLEIDRNICINCYQRAQPNACIYLSDIQSTYYFTAKIRGNLIVSNGYGTSGLLVSRAKDCEIYGNTVVSNLLLTDARDGPGIVIGSSAASGTNIIKNNASDGFAITGTSEEDNNHTLGKRGATIAYATAFNGSTFAVSTAATAKSEFAMKASGPLDADTSGNASVGLGYNQPRQQLHD
jgi:hypothetical protein